MIIRPAEAVVVEEIGQELCVMRLDTSDVLVMNGTASDIWLLLSDGIEPQQLVTSLAKAYARSAADVEADVYRVLADLRERGFVTDDDGRT